jgi:hypothetical protein
VRQMFFKVDLAALCAQNKLKTQASRYPKGVWSGVCARHSRRRDLEQLSIDVLRVECGT